MASVAIGPSAGALAERIKQTAAVQAKIKAAHEQVAREVAPPDEGAK